MSKFFESLGAFFGRVWAAVKSFFAKAATVVEKGGVIECDPQTGEVKPKPRFNFGSRIWGVAFMGLGFAMLFVPVVKAYVFLGLLCCLGIAAFWLYTALVVTGMMMVTETSPAT